MINKKLSNMLRELRESKKLYQKDIAKILNISTSAYGYYEQGKRDPDTFTLKTLADFYGVTSDYLLGREIYGKKYELPEANEEKHEISNFNIELHNDIENLSPASIEELKKYIQLLKLKDTMDKSKDEMSSPLMPNVSKNK